MTANNAEQFIAHRRESNGEIQPLQTHLTEVADIAACLAKKLNLPVQGELLGLLHDYCGC